MEMPKTLSECYEYFNNKLDEKRKEKIKKAEVVNILDQGYGLGITGFTLIKMEEYLGKYICSMKMTFRVQFWMGIIII